MKQVFIHQKEDRTYQVKLQVTKTQSITTEGETIEQAIRKARADLLGMVILWDRNKDIYTKRVIAGRALKKRLTSYVNEELENAKK